jgi:hypothetical protein
MSNFIENNRKKIFDMARKNFTNHVIKKEADHLYLVRNPENSFFWFRMAFLPEMVLLYGDVGELVLCCRSACDPQGWLANAHKSPDYMLSKVPYEFRREEFYQEYAEEIIKEYLDDGSINVNAAENILDEMESYNWDPAHWTWAWSEHTSVDEIPEATDWDARTIHQVVAIETFFNLIDKIEQVSSAARPL